MCQFAFVTWVVHRSTQMDLTKPLLGVLLLDGQMCVWDMGMIELVILTRRTTR